MTTWSEERVLYHPALDEITYELRSLRALLGKDCEKNAVMLAAHGVANAFALTGEVRQAFLNEVEGK